VAWIKTRDYAGSEGELRDLYDRISGPDHQIDKILQAHSLRPHTLAGHMALYKAVLHHAGNRIDRWFLETLGIFVSHLNGCDYCVAHHTAGLRRLLEDDLRADEILRSLKSGDWHGVFDARGRAALAYAKILTTRLAALDALEIDDLRAAGWDDGEILELNQVVAYFSYANRTVLGLGVTTDGEVLGLAPGDRTHPDNWTHG
jgi:uncharacterized peroxidase-related enzyme